MKQPETPTSPRLRPIKIFMVSPGCCRGYGRRDQFGRFSDGGAIVRGGNRVNRWADRIVFGYGPDWGALAQIPVGWLADKYDRRWVLIALSVLGILACGVLAVSSSDNHRQIFLIAALFSASALFAYISLAHIFLVGFGLQRMTKRPTEEKKTAYAYLPRTSFTIAKLLKRSKSR